MEYELVFLGHPRLIRIFAQMALVCLIQRWLLKSLCESKRTGDAVCTPLAPAMASNDTLRWLPDFSTPHSRARPFGEWLLMVSLFSSWQISSSLVSGLFMIPSPLAGKYNEHDIQQQQLFM